MLNRLVSFVALSVLLAACEKSNPTADIAPPKDTASSAPPASAPVASASSSAPPLASLATSAAPVVSAAPSETAAASANANAKAKDAGAAQASSLKPVSKHVAGKNFALDLASPGCKSGAECAVTIKLSTTGEYHVNKEYPYKFIATAAPNLTFLGKSDANTFTRASGDFAEQGEKAGTMTVRFKPSGAGDAQVAGTYKFSVCSADQCQIEQEKLDLIVPVL